MLLKRGKLLCQWTETFSVQFLAFSGACQALMGPRTLSWEAYINLFVSHDIFLFYRHFIDILLKYIHLYNNTCSFCIFIGRELCVIKVHTTELYNIWRKHAPPSLKPKTWRGLVPADANWSRLLVATTDQKGNAKLQIKVRPLGCKQK